MKERLLFVTFSSRQRVSFYLLSVYFKSNQKSFQTRKYLPHLATSINKSENEHGQYIYTVI